MASKTSPTLDPAVLAARSFIKTTAMSSEYFSSEELLTAYKASQLPQPEGDKGWRDRWGRVMQWCEKAGYIRKAGKAITTNRNTHAASTVLWVSRLYTGERTLKESAPDIIDAIYKRWIYREVSDLKTLLWQAYEAGHDSAVNFKPKDPS